jgi:hypothetical protein
MPIDLSLLFSQYAKRFERELKENVRKKIGIDGSAFSSLKEWALSHNRRLNTRLNDTKRFQNNFVKSSSDDAGFKVYGNQNSLDGNITFDDAISYNNKHSARVNTFIANPPLIFPSTDAHLQLMKEFQNFERDALRAIEAQTETMMKQFAVKVTVNAD